MNLMPADIEKHLMISQKQLTNCTLRVGGGSVRESAIPFLKLVLVDVVEAVDGR